MEKAHIPQRVACLQYMSPWIKNLSHCTNPTNELYEPSGAKFRDCVRVLIELTLADQQVRLGSNLTIVTLLTIPQIHAVVQEYIWVEIGKLDSETVNVILDELMRAAVDGGIGSQRCEIVADTMSSVTSINARARIAARIRKVSFALFPVVIVGSNKQCGILGTRQDILQAVQISRRQYSLERDRMSHAIVSRGQLYAKERSASAALRRRRCPLYHARCWHRPTSGANVYIWNGGQPTVVCLCW